LKLRNHEIFLWAATDERTSTVGNLTVHTPGDDEHIITLERFKPLISNIACSQTAVNLTFKDDNSFTHARQEWGWVNAGKNNSFILVVGTKDCIWNDARQPFLVSASQFNESTRSLSLDAVPKQWNALLHTYTLNIQSNSPSIPGQHGVSKRADYHRELPLPFAWTPPKPQLKYNIDNLNQILLDCNPCGTSGGFNLILDIEVEYLIPLRADLNLVTSKLAATITPKLTFATKFIKDYNKTFWEMKEGVPRFSLVIQDVITLGPNLDMSAAFEVKDLRLAAAIETAMTATVPDGALISFDFLPYLWSVGLLPPGVSANGWGVSVTTKPFTLSSPQISGVVKISFNPKLTLSANILGTVHKSAIFDLTN
ncbi:hypothetical protein GQ44DRAFT_634974, partial [Phaeosphaeriaceae sp. PMI808]